MKLGSGHIHWRKERLLTETDPGLGKKLKKCLRKDRIFLCIGLN